MWQCLDSQTVCVACVHGSDIGVPGLELDCLFLWDLRHAVSGGWMKSRAVPHTAGHRAGCASLGEGVLTCLPPAAEVAGVPASAAAFVEELASSLPCFADVATGAEGERVVLHRRAQRLAADLFVRFGQSDTRCRFADMGDIAFDSGSWGVATLLGAGVLTVSDAMEHTISAASDLSHTPAEALLRAAAVVAGGVLFGGGEERWVPRRVPLWEGILHEGVSVRGAAAWSVAREFRVC